MTAREKTRGAKAPARAARRGKGTGAGDRGLEAQIEALVRGDHGDPFSLLGPHSVESVGLAIRSFQPTASRVWVIDENGEEIAELERRHPAGFYAGVVREDAPISYRLRL